MGNMGSPEARARDTIEQGMSEAGITLRGEFRNSPINDLIDYRSCRTALLSAKFSCSHLIEFFYTVFIECFKAVDLAHFFFNSAFYTSKYVFCLLQLQRTQMKQDSS